MTVAGFDDVARFDDALQGGADGTATPSYRDGFADPLAVSADVTSTDRWEPFRLPPLPAAAQGDRRA